MIALTEKDNRKNRKPFWEYDFNPNCFFESQKFRHRVECNPEYCKTNPNPGLSDVLWAEQPPQVIRNPFKRSLEEMTPQNFVETACLTRAINRCMNYPCLTDPG